ncbi:MAG: molybdate ABC transporter substrate-binding protein, partial [Firmicutes bacterium]|nr:molybdate ABC transporter substrate-binding protein [Bacillota bacterium]
SGTLQTQLEEGADCDVFLSAAEKQMDALDGEGLLLAGSRVDLLQNELVLVAPKGNPANIRTFEDAARADSVALGNSDVPAGQYAREIFTNLGLWTEDFLSRVTLASNVKEVVSWVSEGAVDCGVVYKTDAKAAGLEIAASAPEGSLDTPVLYPAAVLANSANPGAALAFLAFLRSDEATAIFENAGFAIPQ